MLRFSNTQFKVVCGLKALAGRSVEANDDGVDNVEDPGYGGGKRGGVCAARSRSGNPASFNVF